MAKKSKKRKRRRHQMMKNRRGQTRQQRSREPIHLPSYSGEDELMDAAMDDLANTMADKLAAMTKDELADALGDKLASMPINDLAKMLVNELMNMSADELADVMSEDLTETLDDEPPDMPIILPTQELMRDMPIVEDGYRIVGPAQAMVDYAQPLMGEADSEEELNDVFQTVQLCWSLAITQRREPEEFDRLKKKAISDLDVPEPEELLDMMIERFDLMFPDLGRRPSFYVKERVIDVEEYEPFDESTLHISKNKIPPTEQEIGLAKTMTEIDPDDESELMEWLGELVDCYAKWCDAKGVPDDKIWSFGFAVSFYLDFLRNYYGEVVSADTPREVVKEFMHVNFIRKTAEAAAEKTMMPCALKLFMQYLDEKGIVTGTKRIVRIIESEQDAFQKALKLYTDPSLGK